MYENYISPTVFRFRSGSKTKKVNGKYVQNTEWTRAVGFVTAPVPGAQFFINPTWAPNLLIQPPTVSATNKLYGKLREELLGRQGSLLTTSVEWKLSLDMISGRARVIGSAFLAVRKFQFKKAARILGIATPSRYKNLSKAQAKAKKLLPTSIWLEYWMGWAPLYGDIANAVETLAKGPQTTLRRFSVGILEKANFTMTVGEPGSSYTYVKKAYSTECRYSAYGKVMVTNHNHQLANQLGFTNPARTLWEILPFSFMVDWFTNVGQVLGSLTDFESLTFSDTGTAMAFKADFSANGRQYSNYNYYPVSQTGWYELYWRKPGNLPMPQLAIKMLDKLSLTRAATSISLLVEIFLRK